MNQPNDIAGIETRFDPCTGAVHAQYEWGRGESLDTTVVSVVSAVTGTAMDEMDPLFDAVDPDALNDILAPIGGRHLRAEGGCVAFTFDGCDVSIYWDGEIVVHCA